jgi:hypothetical protein
MSARDIISPDDLNIPLDMPEHASSVVSTPELSSDPTAHTALVPPLIIAGQPRQVHGTVSGAAGTSGVISALSGGSIGDVGAASSPKPRLARAQTPAAPARSPAADASPGFAHAGAHVEPALSDPGAAERRAVRSHKRRLICIAGAALCVLLLVFTGFVLMTVFGGLCAASLSGSGAAHWACGGSGAATAAVLLVLGLLPFALLCLTMSYNAVYFMCCSSNRRPADSCCLPYNELSF